MSVIDYAPIEVTMSSKTREARHIKDGQPVWAFAHRYATGHVSAQLGPYVMPGSVNIHLVRSFYEEGTDEKETDGLFRQRYYPDDGREPRYTMSRYELHEQGIDLLGTGTPAPSFSLHVDEARAVYEALKEFFE